MAEVRPAEDARGSMGAAWLQEVLSTIGSSAIRRRNVARHMRRVGHNLSLACGIRQSRFRKKEAAPR